MTYSDKELGMDRSISRRDFLNGAAALVATATPAGALAGADPSDAGTYPPARTGLRGSHVGSYEVAHELVWQGKRDWGRVRDADPDLYDVVVVGAGISGLSAAWFYRDAHPDARILVLDNHDDFGGHAKRNEFTLDGKTLIAYGGSQTLEDPGSYSAIAKGLLSNLGVRTQAFEAAYDHDFFRRNGLSAATYFDSEHFGADRLVGYPLVDYTSWLPIAEPSMDVAKAVSQMPLTENARRELLQLVQARGNRLAGIPAADQEDFLRHLSYRDFLVRHLSVTDPDVLRLFQGLTADTTASIEGSNALGALTYTGLPGLGATALPADPDAEPYIHHFPDGNASIARLLVRQLVPSVAPGSSMDDIVLAPFDYSKLDDRESAVRIRLNSTVVRVEHDGPPGSARQVSAIYVNNGEAHRVRARACVMAGYNAMIPSICPEIPSAQGEALAQAIKAPIVYTNVLLRNWRAWRKLGVGIFGSPAAYYAVAALDFPVNLGGYRFSSGPDEPIIVHMERFAKGSDPDATPREQRIAGRRELYATSFETIERATRRQLAGALAEGSFDPAEDIAGITVNRWGHGYAYWFNPLFDVMPDNGDLPNVAGRRRLGRIATANSDAGGDAVIDAAIDEAYRAVRQIAS
jgi:spermidine dehydrogenase